MKFTIIGIGQFGRALAKHLAQNRFEVTAIDRKESSINEIKDAVEVAIVGEATDPRLLRQLDLGDDTCVIITVGESFERNILIAAQLKEMGVKRIYARYVNDLQGRVLERLGVNDLFRVEDAAAKQLALRFINEGLMRLRKIDTKHSLADVKLPAAWVGRTLADSGLRPKYRLNLLTVRRGVAQQSAADDDVMVQMEQSVIDETPGPDLLFPEGDVLVLYGKDDDLQRFVDIFEL